VTAEYRVASAGSVRPHPVLLTALLREYKENELAADQRYKGTVITTTGMVDSIKKDILGDPFITLQTQRGFQIPALQCSLSKSAVNQATRLSPGDSVTIIGRVSGLMMNVQVRDCTFD
jgi:hypothetical protein